MVFVFKPTCVNYLYMDIQREAFHCHGNRRSKNPRRVFIVESHGPGFLAMFFWI